MHEIALGPKRRLETISLIYRYLILNYDLLQMKQDVLSEKQFVIEEKEYEAFILDLIENIPETKQVIEPYLKKEWKWERLPNFVKAALIEGVFEIKNTPVDKATIINDIVKNVKKMQPDWDYRFVNAILDNFNKN